MRKTLALLCALSLIVVGGVAVADDPGGDIQTARDLLAQADAILADEQAKPPLVTTVTETVTATVTETVTETPTPTPTTPPPAPETYGPTAGIQAIKDGAGPRGSVSCEAGGISVSPSMTNAAIQSAIDSAGPVQVCWQPGTYTPPGAGYDLRAGQIHVFTTGPVRAPSDTAVLRGGASPVGPQSQVVFRGPDITLRGGIFENSLGGGILVNRNSNTSSVDSALLEDFEIRNPQGGSGFGSSSYACCGAPAPPPIDGLHMRFGLITGGPRYNYSMGSATNVEIDHMEFSNGNRERHPEINDEGSSKISKVNSMEWHHNWSHDNFGDEWWDFGNRDIIISESVFSNFRMGVNYEANPGVEFGGGALITHNAFVRNGVDTPIAGWSRRACGIWIHSSPDVEISFNLFEDDIKDIHPYSEVSPRYNGFNSDDTRNLWVHDNLFVRTRPPAWSEGFVSTIDSGTSVYLASSNNRFDRNTYRVLVGQENGTYFFYPSGTSRNFTQWRQGDPAPRAGSSHFDPNGMLELIGA